MKNVNFEDGDIIFKKDESIIDMYIIKMGTVEFLDDSGQVNHTKTEGEMFGNASSLDKPKYEYTSRAKDGVVSCLSLSM